MQSRNGWTHFQFIHQFLKLFFDRSPGSNSHDFILQFLLSEAAFYAEASKAGTFILDLMKLDVPNLFASPPHSTGESFKKDLHLYIFANTLSRELQKNVESIMVSKQIFLNSNYNTLLAVISGSYTWWPSSFPRPYSHCSTKGMWIFNCQHTINCIIFELKTKLKVYFFCWTILKSKRLQKYFGTKLLHVSTIHQEACNTMCKKFIEAKCCYWNKEFATFKAAYILIVITRIATVATRAVTKFHTQIMSWVLAVYDCHLSMGLTWSNFSGLCFR